MNIRFQLLIIAATTLVLPWAGCEYARELETTLRDSQRDSLRAAAVTVADALAAQPQRVFRDVDDSQPFDPAQGDVYVFTLHAEPLLDGYREDWDLAEEPTAVPSAGLTARLQAGFTERYLFLYLEVNDPTFDPEPTDVHPDHDRFDRVDLSVQGPDGALRSYFFGTGAPGLIEAQSLAESAGVVRAAPEARIQAFWLQTSRGYHVEARIPRSLVGGRAWIEASDGASGAKAGFLGIDPLRGGRLFTATPGLDGLLAALVGPGTRATVVDANALKLGTAGSLARTPEEPAMAGSWFRRDPLLSARAPIMIDGRPRGAVVLEQAGTRLFQARDKALARLVNLTLLASALAAAIAFGIAAWISARIGRLRTAADTAVGNDGRIRLNMPESGHADEIGSLARGFERLLVRLNEHTHYLRTLGGKLSHELRTPLAIVRSSLDNLESEGIRADQQRYVTRAREGVLRLQSILSALGAASRVEESIRQAERVMFDLRELLQASVAGYCDAFRDARIVLEVPTDACFQRGAPDLMVQMLDKLVENAVDFRSPSGVITVRLIRSGGDYELSVANDGPPIPPDLTDRLFESLFEHRQGMDDKPHFGLGLYIVRLIAEFHAGRAFAANRTDGAGALFTVTLPRI